MKNPVKIPLQHTRSVNALIADYLNKKSETESFYSFYPSLDGFRKAIASPIKKTIPQSILSEILLKQHGLVKNSTKESEENIRLLSKQNSFTITTGHQLCLNTGPLYFIYKIISVIRLSQILKKEFPLTNFIPVFWLAGEDHDFDEINHFNIYKKQLQWNIDAKGSVGHLNTNTLDAVFSDYQTLLGSTMHSDYLKSLFENSYLKHDNLKDAARFLVNNLFGEYGLVIVDGDDLAFKEAAMHLFTHDIKEKISHHEVQKTNEQLENLNYKVQVTPREINFFYASEQSRERIVYEDKKYRVLNTDKQFTDTEFFNHIADNPINISPNVVTRPLYQQFLLPNLAYVGGAGELAYWLQYKTMFEKHDLFFPVLVPRDSFTLVEEKTALKMEKLNLSPENIFSNEIDLEKQVIQSLPQYFELTEEKLKLQLLYTELKDKMKKFEPTLEGSVSAELQTVLKGIDNLQSKINKAVKLKSDGALNQLKNVLDKLFPERELQERTENFAQYYNEYGSDFFKVILTHSNPLDLSHKILILSKNKPL
ncbi:MAG: bacillithiol biosynthesis cysteine-adding enzyme BshC [Sphingobacteriaceae bacterium]|nr:bacillithiol biosynthesis cysteine-adding enzyme BshC [Sphingobacteriaceae bacterium]